MEFLQDIFELIFDLFDINNNGTLEFYDFTEAVYDSLDRNNDGQINWEDVHLMIADNNGDGEFNHFDVRVNKIINSQMADDIGEQFGSPAKFAFRTAVKKASRFL